jgi:NADPH:quinone reductase-like Zn-dependent oxidoreductase
VGPGVTDRAVGMPVFGMVDHAGAALNGAYAQYSLANASSTAPEPANLSFGEAAGLGVAGVTALRILDDSNAQAGQRLLITGAAGGVGSTTAQIAVARGIVVLGTASPRHDAYLHEIGVSQLIDYTKGDIAGQAGRTDAVIDTVGGSEAIDALHSVKPGGRFVSVGHAEVTAEQCASAQVQCLGSPGSAASAPLAVLLEVAHLAGEGKLRAHVDQTYPLEHAADALQYVHQGHTEGKVILAVTGDAEHR